MGEGEGDFVTAAEVDVGIAGDGFEYDGGVFYGGEFAVVAVGFPFAAHGANGAFVANGDDEGVVLGIAHDGRDGSYGNYSSSSSLRHAGMTGVRSICTETRLPVVLILMTPLSLSD